MSLASVIVGLALLGISMYWGATADAPPMTYSDEEAQEYLDTAAKLHDMAFQSKPTGNQKKPLVSAEELTAQRQKYAEEKAAVESARSRTEITRWVLMGAGLVFTVGGLFAYKLTSE
jgi:hypothetical protein